MAEAATKPPVKQDSPPAREPAPSAWHPFDTLRKEVDRLFDDFTRGLPGAARGWWADPLWRGTSLSTPAAPATDLVENDKAFVITAELPGIDEKEIEVSFADDMLTISGEKKAEKEERDKNTYVSERRYGSFQRSLRLPRGIESDRIEATFDKGVLTVTLPKSPEMQRKEKKIAVKAK